MPRGPFTVAEGRLFAAPSRCSHRTFLTPWPSLFLTVGVMQNAIAGGGVVFKF